MPLKRRKPVNGGCQATTRAGRSCQAPPIKGERYCSFHLHTDRASDLGRLGVPGTASSIPRLDLKCCLHEQLNRCVMFFQRRSLAYVQVV